MKKRFWSILLILVMLLGTVPTATVFADERAGRREISLGIGGIDGYDSEKGYNYIYFGNMNDAPVKWRVLDDKTNTGEDGLFLLSEILFGRTKAGGIFFNGNPGATNDWQTSSARYWCVNEFKAFTDAEYAAIMETYKSDRAYLGPAVENILNGDKIFFLSAEEIDNRPEYGFPMADPSAKVAYYNGEVRAWLLRSPYASDEDDYVILIGFDGKLARTSINSNRTARPAFNLAPEGVLFSSPAVGGKTAFGLSAVGNSVEERICGNSRRPRRECGSRRLQQCADRR